ncbi:conserved hypothetical protein [Aromatoleum aromaticum EbN1]|uniref:ABM domain-containing protein n=1 Tax=Aromatoleum aromaticum (strain DSM 19018 / LMG 30748 / EbN1) TaxID=76114 RepID=Q5P8S9_AROAE|nr:hypothetical protein [Aromatoleum aromaticum]CAI06280.1 conserved hypothetical protein [Aromatoleum aromaticum EbN1]
MITTIVEYKLPSALTRGEILEKFKAAQEKFIHTKGLLKKYFCYNSSDATGTSVYLWESLSCAEAFFTSEMLHAFEKTFGCRPEVRHVDTLMTIDNVTDEVSVFHA